MSQTLLGILIGGVITTIVAHYYFRRGRRKSLTPFVILSSNVFSGIDKEDRKKLRFEYMGTEIADLYQLEFLIGNDGELAVSNCIKPLTLTLPSTAQLLDASIIYRQPETLEVSVERRQSENGSQYVEFAFPLLNRGDFFVIKLLLGGRIRAWECCFNILAEDLPREFWPRRLPPEIRKGYIGLDWGILSVFVGFLFVGSLLTYTVYRLYVERPDLFFLGPASFYKSIDSLLIMPLALLVGIALIGLGITAIIGVLSFRAFSFHNPPFSIPEEIATRSFHLTFANLRRLSGQKMYIVEPSPKDTKEGTEISKQ